VTFAAWLGIGFTVGLIAVVVLEVRSWAHRRREAARFYKRYAEAMERLREHEAPYELETHK
jgi:FtsZ-interacting cell division protein ZipA